MSYDANQIISITTRISPQGLGFANFASAMAFAPESELPDGFDTDTYREYTSLNSLSSDFDAATETYKVAQKWFSGVPATTSLKVWGTADSDTAWANTLNKARNMVWWFWSFFTAPIYAVESNVLAIAAWSEANEAYFQNCQTGTAAAAIRNPDTNTDIATQLTALGYRYTSTFAHATDAYAGIALTKWFASVNYSAANSTITGEYKKLSGVVAEQLPDSEYSAMKKDTKKCQFYTFIDLQGSTDAGRTINSYTHSTYGEYMDDVVNLAAFVNGLVVTLYDAIANQSSKLAQTPSGQALLINSTKAFCESYVSNGYLGARDFLDPDDGVTKLVPGYQVLTKPEDILSISPEDRAARKSAPMRVRIFRAGAIHSVNLTLDVF